MSPSRVDNANDLLNTVVSSYHILTDRLHLGRTRSIDWIPLLEDVAGVSLDRRYAVSPEADLEELSDSFWIEELDPRADRVLTSRDPHAGDLFFLSLVILAIDAYTRLVSPCFSVIEELRSAAVRALAMDFCMDLGRRPSPEPEIAIVSALEAAHALERWIHRP